MVCSRLDKNDKQVEKHHARSTTCQHCVLQGGQHVTASASAHLLVVGQNLAWRTQAAGKAASSRL
jgi:hypothetical protein